jgi:hypothetical protein
MRAADPHRIAVWKALSELFLDTDPALLEDGIVGALAASPYDVDEIEAILLWEVYPVCRRNLASVAGAWSGFDEEWLLMRIAARRSWSTRLHTATFGREWVRRSPEWRRVRARLSSLLR